MRTSSLTLLVVVVGMCCSHPATAREFKSEKARQARTKFLRAVETARDDYISELNEAAKEAITADDLDEALQIKEKIEDLNSEKRLDRGDPVVQLRRRLTDTSWTLIRDNDPKDVELLRFHSKNRVTKVYGKRTGTGIWESIESHLVVAKFNEKLLLFQFDDKLTSFQAVAFGPVHTAYTSGRRGQ